MGGGIGALVNWLISFMLTSLLGIYYLISFVVAQFVNILVNFFWHRYITFRVRNCLLDQLLRFVLLSSITVLLSIGLVFILKEYVIDRIYSIIAYGFKLNYLVAIVSVTFLVSVINYIVSKMWIFTTNLDKSR
jgi:putative flippase GtrA